MKKLIITLLCVFLLLSCQKDKWKYEIKVYFTDSSPDTITVSGFEDPIIEYSHFDYLLMLDDRIIATDVKYISILSKKKEKK